jgi:hypothetical protein
MTIQHVVREIPVLPNQPRPILSLLADVTPATTQG